MKKEYNAPSVDVKEFELSDILTVSGASTADGYNEGVDTMGD